MGKQLWNSLLRDPTPAKETLQAVLRELKPIAVKGYSDVRFRQLYDRYLLNLYDLKFSEIIADTETTKPLQRCAARLDRPAEVPPVVHEALRSPGQPLDFETQAFMETRFGHDFNRVRVHTAAPAEESARLMGARSYTVGPDIVFANGSYGPTTTEGRKLLAHELAHVVQQRGQDGAGVQGELEVSQPTDAAETEADQVAERVMQGLTQNAIVMQRAALQLQRMPDVGFTVNNMNLAKGLLDDPTDNGMGVVTWPLSFAVTSPLEAAPEVEITGSAGDPCTSHSVGFLQTVHIQWIHIHYQGRSTGDGSTVLSYTVPLPIRDGDPGDMWYTTDGVDTPTGCNVTIHPHMDDYPTLWDIAKVRTNSLTGQANYLTYITRGIHFVTTLADSGPAGVKPLRFFYWNYLMDIEFTPNYASPNAVWPFKWKKNTATIGKVHTGGDSSVPMFTSATTPYNQSLTLNTVESK